MKEEYVVLVNDKDEPLGTMEKNRSARKRTFASSIFGIYLK
jgi:isopentenyldiphosphate isomerase